MRVRYGDPRRAAMGLAEHGRRAPRTQPECDGQRAMISEHRPRWWPVKRESSRRARWVSSGGHHRSSEHHDWVEKTAIELAEHARRGGEVARASRAQASGSDAGIPIGAGESVSRRIKTWRRAKRNARRVWASR